MRQLVGVADGRRPARRRCATCSCRSRRRRCGRRPQRPRRRRAPGRRRPDALRHRARRLGRRRRLRRRGALGRVRHPGRRARPRRDRRPAAADVLRRRAEAPRPRGAAARRRRRPAARRARQLPRRPGQALAGGRAAGVAQDGPVRQPRPRAAGRHGDAIVTVEADGTWTHGGGFAGYHEARQARLDKLARDRSRYDDERKRLEELVAEMRRRAKISDDVRAEAEGGREPAAPVRRAQRAAGRRPRAADRRAPRRRPHRQAGA